MTKLSGLPQDDRLTGQENVIMDDGRISKKMDLGRLINHSGEVGTESNAADNFCYCAVVPYGSYANDTVQYMGLLSSDRRILSAMITSADKLCISVNDGDVIPLEMCVPLHSMTSLGIPDGVELAYGWSNINDIWPVLKEYTEEQLSKGVQFRGILSHLKQTFALKSADITDATSQQVPISNYVDLFNDLENVDYLLEGCRLPYPYGAYSGALTSTNADKVSQNIIHGIFPTVSSSTKLADTPYVYSNSRFPNAKSAKYVLKDSEFSSGDTTYLSGHFPHLENWSHVFDGMYPHGITRLDAIQDTSTSGAVSWTGAQNLTNGARIAATYRVDFSANDHPNAVDLSYMFANWFASRPGYESIKDIDPLSKELYIPGEGDRNALYGINIEVRGDVTQNRSIPKIKSMSHMFYKNRFFSQITIGPGLTDSVEDASYMFAHAMSSAWFDCSSGNYADSYISGTSYDRGQQSCIKFESYDTSSLSMPFMPVCVNASHMFANASVYRIVIDGRYNLVSPNAYPKEFESFPLLENADYMFYNLTGQATEYRRGDFQYHYEWSMQYKFFANPIYYLGYASNSETGITRLDQIIGTGHLKTAAYMFATDKPSIATSVSYNETFLTTGLKELSFPALEHSHAMFGVFPWPTTSSIDFTSANAWADQDWFEATKSRGGFHGMFSDPVTHRPRDNYKVPDWYTEDMYWPTEEMLADWEEKYDKPNREEE